MNRFSIWAVPILSVVMLAACGGSGGNPSSPSSPSPTPSTYTLTGRVLEAGTGAAIGGANVAIGDGPNSGRSASTDSSGNYSLSGLQQAGFTVTASADGYVSRGQGVTLTSNQTLNFNLERSGPRTTFGPGQYLVNTDIASGRYFSVPRSGCYWERESGLGGTLGEIIANDFIAFDAHQWIVDVLPSDRAFKTDADCGSWSMTPRVGAQTGIEPGMYLVGSQLQQGTYRANVAAGCYWERLRNFEGKLSSIIANDFVSSGGSQLVEIRPGDVGFDSDADCGTWTRVSGIASTSREEVPQSPSDIEHNWQMHRQRSPRTSFPPRN